jgi:hypothetical protein
VARDYRNRLADDINPEIDAWDYDKGYGVKDPETNELKWFYNEKEAKDWVRYKSGKMYEVNINADPDDFLDWDKPMTGQSDKVRDALVAEKFAGPRADEMAIRDLVPMDTPEATAALREAGIPGIKYLDQGSRAAGEGSRNYVVFDEDLIEIQRKYAQLGLPVPPIGLLRADAEAKLPAPPLPPQFIPDFVAGRGA